MSFTKRSVPISLVALVVIAVLVGISLRTSIEAASETVIEAKEVLASKIPTFKGTAYIAGHGGHLAIIDMNTMKAPTDVEKDRIILTEAGSEMEGKIAGMDFEQVKKSGGSHGQALISKNVLVASTLAGNVYKLDLKTGKKEGPFKVDTATDEIVKRIVLPDDVVVHDFAFSKDGKYAFISARTNGKDDSLMHIMDRSSYNIVGKVSACGACHKANGVEVRIDGGSPNLCGLEIAWK